MMLCRLCARNIIGMDKYRFVVVSYTIQWGNNVMRKDMILVLVILLLSMSLGSVEAANSQGFEWGVDVGDRIDYTLTYSQPSITTDPTGTINFYATIITLPTIPEPVTSYWEIVTGSAAAEFHYANGTQLFMVPWGMIAIGNWSLVTELYEAQAASTTTVSETAVDWIYVQQMPSGGDGALTTELRFSKTDGVMNFYELKLVDGTGAIISSSMVVRSGYSTGFLGGGIDPMLLIAVGAGGAIVVVAVIFMRKK